jgi:uncharacterized membrane protein
MIARLLIAAGFLAGGILHFTKTDTYARICPDYLPNHRALVLVSGAAEIAGAIGILIPQTRRITGYGLIALLIAVFPANVNMAVNAKQFEGFAPAWALWLRLPLQILFIIWVRSAAIPKAR